MTNHSNELDMQAMHLLHTLIDGALARSDDDVFLPSDGPLAPPPADLGDLIISAIEEQVDARALALLEAASTGALALNDDAVFGEPSPPPDDLLATILMAISETVKDENLRSASDASVCSALLIPLHDDAYQTDAIEAAVREAGLEPVSLNSAERESLWDAGGWTPALFAADVIVVDVGDTPRIDDEMANFADQVESVFASTVILTPDDTDARANVFRVGTFIVTYERSSGPSTSLYEWLNKNREQFIQQAAARMHYRQRVTMEIESVRALLKGGESSRESSSREAYRLDLMHCSVDEFISAPSSDLNQLRRALQEHLSTLNQAVEPTRWGLLDRDFEIFHSRTLTDAWKTVAIWSYTHGLEYSTAVRILDTVYGRIHESWASTSKLPAARSELARLLIDAVLNEWQVRERRQAVSAHDLQSTRGPAIEFDSHLSLTTESRELLERISELPPIQRGVVLLRMNRFSLEEVAEILAAPGGVEEVLTSLQKANLTLSRPRGAPGVDARLSNR